MNEQEIRILFNRVDAAIKKAVTNALLDHKRTGDPIVVGDKNGKVRWIQAKDIKID